MKTTPELIEALKNNEKPFGLMSRDMQRAATEIGMRKFEYVGFLNCDPKWYGLDCPSWDKKSFDSGTTYHLKDSYQPESEIVECEIKADGMYLKFNFNHGTLYEMGVAPTLRDFIGFKFCDDSVHPFPVKYEYKDKTRGHLATPYMFASDGTKVLHATHVLFRGDK